MEVRVAMASIESARMQVEFSLIAVGGAPEVLVQSKMSRKVVELRQITLKECMLGLPKEPEQSSARISGATQNGLGAWSSNLKSMLRHIETTNR